MAARTTRTHPVRPKTGNHPAPADPLISLEPTIAAMMAEWHVPGLALGVIREGRVIHAQGYGYRDLEAGLPVTARTIMAIGSNTKSFTAVLLGMLVEEKKIDWDTPVKAYLPDFQLHDEYATRHMTPRDLMCHRSGLPHYNVLWNGRRFQRQELYDRLRFLEPTASFRGRWQYQNLMFMVAGCLVERVTGRSWEELLRERVLTPLGMTRANTSVAQTPDSDDFAWPYAFRQEALVRIPLRNIDPVGPAGSINASVEDMLRYLQFRIGLGTVDGTQLLPKAQALEMERPQMPIPMAGDEIWKDIVLLSYGLGVAVGSYRGHRMVLHGGGIDGFISQMAWLPDDGIGVVALSNQGNANPIPDMVVKTVADRILGFPPRDLIGEQRERGKADAKKEAEDRARLAAERTTGTAPSHPLSEYAGTFSHPGFGAITVQAGAGGLAMVCDDLANPLEHYHYDTFRGDEDREAHVTGGLVTFLANTKGALDRMLMPVGGASAPVVFTRI